MTILTGTRVYWRPAARSETDSPRQILKNSGYINVVLQAVQYKSSGNFWQQTFGGRNKITLSTHVLWQSGSDSKTAAVIQDVREIAVPSRNILAIGRNVVLKVPAGADGLELQVHIGAVQDDNLARTLQLLNSEEFKKPLQLAPVLVGQAITIATMVKKVFTGPGTTEVLAASYPGIISEEEIPNPIDGNRLVEGYIILMVKQDEADRLDFDPEKLTVNGNELLFDGAAVPNTYVVYNVSFDRWRGRDTGSSWSMKFEQASSRLDDLILGKPGDRQSAIDSAVDLLKAGIALLDEDVNYITFEKRNLKKSAIQELQAKITSSASASPAARGALSSLSPPLAALVEKLEFSYPNLESDVATYAAQLEEDGATFDFDLPSGR